MERAVEGLALEYRFIFVIFFIGLMFFYISACLYCVIVLNWLLSTLLTVMLFIFVRYTFRACKRIYKKFRLPSQLAVAGSFNADGTVGASLAPTMSSAERRLSTLSVKKRVHHWPLRQYLYLRIFLDEFVGVSAEVYERRYRTVAEKGDRWYNHSITAILRHLELPAHPACAQLPGSPKGSQPSRPPPTPHQRPLGALPAGGAPALPASRSNGAQPAKGFRRMMTSSGRFGGWRATSEEVASLPGSAGTELELAAMSPLEHHISGAISPPGKDSDGDSQGYHMNARV